MTHWILQNDSGSVVLDIEENDQTGGMTGTITVDGIVYSVAGGWSASGSVVGRSASVFSVHGSGGIGDAPIWLGASGLMTGPGASPESIDLHISIASGANGAMTRLQFMLRPPGVPATKKEKIVVLSDIHIGMGTPTVWFQPSVHGPYLEAICNWVIENAGEIQEMVLLGDTIDTWTIPAEDTPPTPEQIFKHNTDIFGPTGCICRVMDALGGNVTLLPGNHDMDVTANDMQYVVSAGGHTMKFVADTYLPPMPYGGQKRVALQHGHQYTMFNAVDPQSPWNGLPVGHFVTRMVASEMKRKLKPGQTVADLKNQGAPDGLDYFSIVYSAFQRKDLNVTEALLDSVIASTGTPSDQSFVLNPTTTVSLSDVQKQYANLFQQWEVYQGGGTMGLINSWKAVLADARAYYMGFFGQRAAFTNSADLVVFGHTHIPTNGLTTTLVTYANAGFECPSIPDVPPQATTFAVVDTATMSTKLMVCADGGKTISEASFGPVAPVKVPPDDSCYVKIINDGLVDLQLVDYAVTDGYGYFAATPPQKIPAGQFGLVWLQDIAGVLYGSQGTVTYKAGPSGTPQVFTFGCPYTVVYSNNCSGGSSFRTKSGTATAWGAPGHVATSGSPFYVEFTVV